MSTLALPTLSLASRFAAGAILLLTASAATSQAETYLFDFGSSQSTGTVGDTSWNTVTTAIGTSSGATLGNILTSNGLSSSLVLLMVDRFNGENTNGTTASLLYPGTATRDSLFGNTETFGAGANFFPKFTISGLDVGTPYNFSFYASRLGVNDTRTTLYTVTGSISGDATLNVANNVDEFVTVSGITPNAFGEITVLLGPAASNNNSNHFTYLGVMEITAVPEPGTTGLLLGGIGLMAARRRRR